MVTKEYVALTCIAHQRAMVSEPGCSYGFRMAPRFNLICVSGQKDEPEVHLSSRVGIVQERSRARHGNRGRNELGDFSLG